MPRNTTARSRPDPGSSRADRRRHGLQTLRVLLVATTLLAVTARIAAAQEHAPEPGYEDDRSTPEATIRSLYDILHLARPQIQAVPPFHPMGIQRASVFEVADDADTATLMQQACGPL